MEQYINDDTLIENEYYNLFQESIMCPLCLCILIKPLMCLECQNVYCQKCIDSWAKKDNKCPNRCTNPNYKRAIAKEDILSNLLFKCKDCKLTIKYNEVEKHMKVCCVGIVETYEINNNSKSKNFQNLSTEELENFKKQGREINYINSKNKLF